MRIIIALLLIFLSITAYCQNISKKDFKNQIADDRLINKKWVLTEISTVIFSKSRSEVSQQPRVYLLFAKQGILQFSFEGYERTFEGRFLQKGTNFRYFSSGINEKVVWTDEKHNYSINPNTIAYTINGGVDSYKIEDGILTLVLTKNRGFLIFR